MQCKKYEKENYDLAHYVTSLKLSDHKVRLKMEMVQCEARGRK